MRYKLKENRDQLAFSFRKKSWKHNLIVLFCLLSVFLFSIRAVWRVYLNFKKSGAQALERQAELSKLEDRESFLREELSRLDTREGKEAKLREKFGVGFPSENIAIIVGSEKEESYTESGLFQRVRDFFSNLLD